MDTFPLVLILLLGIVYILNQIIYITRGDLRNLGDSIHALLWIVLIVLVETSL